MPTVADRLAALGLVLPLPPRPVAAYIPCVRTGNLIFVSGQVPFRDGQLLLTGPVPSRASVDAARDAARQCAVNALAVLADALDGDLERVRRIVRVGVFVQSDPGFADQPKVANGASELLVELFGERGRHARAAVGSVALPLGATVEVEVVAEVDADEA
jgi:enamine deaminase RidA (YjgF/YER057c/UK114 family)